MFDILIDYVHYYSISLSLYTMKVRSIYILHDKPIQREMKKIEKNKKIIKLHKIYSRCVQIDNTKSEQKLINSQHLLI